MLEPLPADRTEDLIAECLERLEAEGDTAIEAVCAQHPESAARVREGVARLRRLGLATADPDVVARDAIPERLGDFRLLRRVGAGGMGVVYLAEQQTLQRQVALKLIRPEFLYFPGARDRFDREIKAVLQLQHPGILPIYTVGETSGIPYFAMEWVDGATLDQVLHHLGGNTPERLSAADLAAIVGWSPVHAGASWVETSFAILQRVAEALHHAHERGVVHRDVKPSNILLARDGRVLLVDFGLALTHQASRLTRTGSQMGSLPYMSPEQVRAVPDRIDRRTDIYSLGVVAFELLTLKTPYFSDTTEVTRKLILEGRAGAIRQLNRTVSRDAEAVCLKSMDVDVERRYHTAEAFAQDLGRVLAHRAVTARRPGPWLRTRRFVQRRPTLSLGIAMGALLFLGALGFAWRERQSADAIRRLADRSLLDYLITTSQSFWPARPDQATQIDRWIAQAEELHARLPLHRASLEELRARAEPYDEAARAHDQVEPKATLAALRRERAGTARFFEQTQIPNAQMELQLIDAAIASEERRLQERRTWTFPSQVDQWRHDQLELLVKELDSLPRRIEEVRHQRDVAGPIVRDTLTSHRERWLEAIADIASSSVYGGLQIQPQLGLIPWRKNPGTGLWEFCHVPSGVCPVAKPTAEDPGHAELDAETGIVLVLLPGGTFKMGSDKATDADKPSDEEIPGNERPRHEVRLDPFFLSKYELTCAQWARLGGEARVDTLVFGATDPAQVSFQQAGPVLARFGLDFPTEAQWEYACRAGTETIYFTGDDERSLQGYANLCDRSTFGMPNADGVPFQPREWLEFNDGYQRLAPVGSFLPNPFGLHDMIGNVAEWCRDKDVWRAYRTMIPRPGDGLRELSRPSEKRCVRGGSCTTAGKGARSAARWGAFDIESRYYGVRPERPIDP
jgi:serine/threonine protein kinase/formylglycine-generating enzyme required for sulfatase activity